MRPQESARAVTKAFRGKGAGLLALALLLTSLAKAGAQSSFRIASWNLRDCAARNPASKAEILLHEDIARFVSQSGVDIAIFEEVQLDTAKGGDIAFLSAALAKAGRPLPFVALADTKGGDDLAIFSRYEVLSQETILIPRKGDAWPRAGLHAVISISGKQLHLFGFHFKALGDAKSESARIAQAKALADLLTSNYSNELEYGYLVIAGDFNTINPMDFGGRGSTLSFLCMKEDANPKNDLFPSNYSYMQNQATFTDSRYSSLLDHILLSPLLGSGLEAKDVKILRPEKRPDGIPVSDHALVAVDLPFPLR